MQEIMQDGIKYRKDTSANPWGWTVVKNVSNTNNHIRIPAVINGTPVTMIGKESFSCNGSLNIIELPDTIRAIFDYAFFGTNLQKVSIYKTEMLSVCTRLSIQQCAFMNCFHLEAIICDKEVYFTGQKVFANCNLLTTFNKDNQVYSSIPAWTFLNCYNLENVVLHARRPSVLSHAFCNCRSLCSLTFTGERLHEVKPDMWKFLKNIKIICKESHPLTELVYTGTKVEILL